MSATAVSYAAAQMLYYVMPEMADLIIEMGTWQYAIRVIIACGPY